MRNTGKKRESSSFFAAFPLFYFGGATSLKMMMFFFVPVGTLKQPTLSKMHGNSLKSTFTIATRVNFCLRLRRGGPWKTFWWKVVRTDGRAFEVRNLSPISSRCRVREQFIRCTGHPETTNQLSDPRRRSKLGECSLSFGWRNSLNQWNAFGTQSCTSPILNPPSTASGDAMSLKVLTNLSNAAARPKRFSLLYKSRECCRPSYEVIVGTKVFLGHTRRRNVVMTRRNRSNFKSEQSIHSSWIAFELPEDANEPFLPSCRTVLRGCS